MKRIRTKKPKFSITELKAISDGLNQGFKQLNNLTGTTVFESAVDPEGFLEMRICGRDALFNRELNCIDEGMYVGNPFIKALQGIEEPPIHPEEFREMRKNGTPSGAHHVDWKWPKLN